MSKVILTDGWIDKDVILIEHPRAKEMNALVVPLDPAALGLIQLGLEEAVREVQRLRESLKDEN